MRLTLFALALCCATVNAHAQAPMAPGGEARAALASQAWRVGKWTGDGWIQMGPDRRMSFRQTEDVRFAAGATSLTMMGLGKSVFRPGGDSVTVLEALAVLWRDPASNALTMRSWIQTGEGGMAAVKVSADTLMWSYDDPRMGRVRYTSMRTSTGGWLERGESSRDNSSWMQFLEMKLSRVP